MRRSGLQRPGGLSVLRFHPTDPLLRPAYLTSPRAGKPLRFMRGLPLMSRIAFVFLLGISAATMRAEEPAAPATGVDWAVQRKETFEIVWKTVDEAYFDSTFGGVDWGAVGEKYRAQLETAEDKVALRTLLQSMIDPRRGGHGGRPFHLPAVVSLRATALHQAADRSASCVSACGNFPPSTRRPSRSRRAIPVPAPR